MKNKVFVLVLFSAVTAPAIGQTNIQLFGIVDAGIASVDRGNGNHIRVDSGFASTSRWGVRGTEDLGNGLSAFFRLESEIEVDTGLGGDGQPVSFLRGAVLGLQGGFGQVWMGRDFQSGYHALQAIDINSFGLYGNLLTFVSGYQAGGGFAATSGMQARSSNGLFWRSPTWGGFQIAAHHSLGERDTEPKSAGNTTGVALFYRTGPLSLAGWYHDRKVLAGTTTTDVKEWGGGGTYSFGTVRVALGYGVGDPEGPRKVSFTSVGASMPLGTGTLSAQYIQLKEAASAGTGKAPSISYQYPLSRRTTLYASASSTRNNNTGNFLLRSSGNTTVPAAVGNDPRGIVFGIRHSF